MKDLKESIQKLSTDMRVRIYLSSALTGVLAGTVVVAYRAAIGRLEATRTEFAGIILSSIPAFLAWLVIALAAGLFTAAMTVKSPLIRGSGIPQVKAFLSGRLGFDWLRDLPLKFAGGSLALGAGLSLGREGPSIQLGSLAGLAVSDLANGKRHKRYLATAGAAAGISAAFNAPLAGVIFCVEELHRNVSPVMLTGTLIASFCANAVMWVFAGNERVFPIDLANVLPLRSYFTGVLAIGVASGLAGSLFNRGILAFQKAYKKTVPNEWARIASAFLAGAAISVTLPLLAGGGSALVDPAAVAAFPLSFLAAILAGKFAFTLFSYASGAPGGIFLPMLSIGALLGALCMRTFPALGFSGEYLNNYLLLGMAAFFTAVVRAPITGAVLITEMAGSFAHFPAFIFVSVVATVTASALRTKPIYDSLLANLAPEGSPGPADAAGGGAAADGRAPEFVHVSVSEGSILASLAEWQELIPEYCVPVAVERGEDKVFPGANLALQSGDTLVVIAEARRIKELRPILENLGKGAGEE